MLRIWRLRQARTRAEKEYAKEIAALRKKKGAASYEFSQLEYDHYLERKNIDNSIEYLLSQRLLDEANNLDVPKPPYTEKEMWEREEEDGEVMMWLSASGRAHLRKLISEEKARRFESRTLWITKFWLPLLAALIGIIGALTGLIAVSRKPAEPKQKPPAYEQTIKD